MGEVMKFVKPKRYVTRVFVHCSASDDPALVGQKLIDTITHWHLNRKPPLKPFKEIGYHFVIDKPGQTFPCRSLEKIPAGQEGHNIGSIAICVHGLKDFTPTSMSALQSLCQEINSAYEGKVTFHGHKEVNPHKECPVYDYKKILNLEEGGRMKSTQTERK
jgi:N-acetylmuramoyl-L-alanine amidase